MNGGRGKQRQLAVCFKRALSGTDSHAVTDAVLAIDGVTRAEYRAGRLDITYSFPETTIESVLAGIEQVAGKAMQQPLNRCTNGLLSFLETNERDHLENAGGWRRYIEDIYMRCSDSRLKDRLDIRNQTWRKYN